MNFFNIFKRKPKTGYSLEVTDTSMPKSVKKVGSRKGYLGGRKFLTGLLTATIFASGLTGGAVAVASQPEQASAFLEPAICNTKDNRVAYLGGKSNTVDAGLTAETKNSPVGFFNVTIPGTNFVKDGKPFREDTRWTALEHYGYYAPSYESWVPLYIDVKEDEDWPYMGSGGNGIPDKPGPLVGVTKPLQTKMYTSNLMDCLGWGGSLNTASANFFSFLTKFSIFLASESYGLASTIKFTTDPNSPSPLKELSLAVEELINGPDGLKNLLYLDWLILIIFIAAIGLIWTGLVKRSSLQAGQGAIWMIGATVAGVLLLTYPMAIPNAINSVVAGFTQGISASLTKSGTNVTDAHLCALPSPGSSASTEVNNAFQVRQVKCLIWYSTIYTPWVKGQFGVDESDLFDYASGRTGSGSTASGNNSTQIDWMFSDSYTATSNAPGSSSVVAFSGKVDGDGFPEDETPASVSGSRGILSQANINFGGRDASFSGGNNGINWAIYHLDRQNNWQQNRGVDYSEIAFNQLVVNKNTGWANPAGAVGSSIIGLFSAAGPVLVLTALSFTMIIYQFSVMLLILIAPFMLLAGVAPGWGRGIAMRWLELGAGLLVKQIILALFLILYIRIYLLIINEIGAWFLQLVLILAFSLLILTQRHKVTDFFTTAINFGGDKRVLRNFDNGLERAGNRIVPGTLRAAGTASKTARDGYRATVATGRKAKDAIQNRKGGAAAVGRHSSKRGQKQLGKVNADKFDINKLSEAEKDQVAPIVRNKNGRAQMVVDPNTGELVPKRKVDKDKLQSLIETKRNRVIKTDARLQKRRERVKSKQGRLDRKIEAGTISKAEAKAQALEIKKEKEAIRLQAQENNSEATQLIEGRKDGVRTRKAKRPKINTASGSPMENEKQESSGPTNKPPVRKPAPAPRPRPGKEQPKPAPKQTPPPRPKPKPKQTPPKG